MLVRQLTSRNYLGKWSFRLVREKIPADNERANNGRVDSISPTKRRRNFATIEPLERVVFRLNVQERRWGQVCDRNETLVGNGRPGRPVPPRKSRRRTSKIDVALWAE